MAKKHNRIDLVRRKLFLSVEVKKILLRYFLIKINFYLSNKSKLISISTQRFFFMQAVISLELNKFIFNSSKVRIRNRCILTGRSRGIYRYFKLSRMMVRKMMSGGFLLGIRKAAW